MTAWQSTEKFIDSIQIAGLPANTYYIRISDENGCFPKNDDGSEKISQVQIKEPDSGVRILSSETKSPAFYRGNDGEIKISVPVVASPDYYTFAWRKNGVPFTPALNSNRATGLGKGVYFVRVTNGNYAAAVGETNCRGCYDTLTVILTEPDSLAVRLSESTKIKCYGESGGISVKVEGGVKPYGTYRLTTDGSEGFPAAFPAGGDGFVVSSLSAGKYSVTVADANGIDRRNSYCGSPTN